MEADAIALADALPFAGEPDPSLDLDARADRFKWDAILETRRAYFYARCPADYVAFNPEHENIQANRAQIERILAWKHNAKGLIASGPTGEGKTRAMYALCMRLLCKEGRDVAIWHAQDFFAELQANVRFGRDEAGDFVKRQANRAVLFIDDYGQEALQANREEWAQGWFFRLLDLRIGNRLPLLITTNLTASQMAGSQRAISSDPMVRRLLELVEEPVKFIETKPVQKNL